MDVVMVDPWDDAALRDWHDVWVAAQRERNPDEAPDPFDFIAAHTRVWPTHEPNRLAVAADGAGRSVAALWLRWWEGPDNRHRAECLLVLRPDAEVAGQAGALLRPVAELAGGIGRTLLGLDVEAGSPAAALAREAGARSCLVERRSLLRLADVDRAEISSWVALPAGYSLVTWDDRCPDALLPAYVRALDAMNTAPRDDLAMDDIVMSPERAREHERVALARGATSWVVAVRHDQTGEIAAFTEVSIHRTRPWLADQQNTAVVPGHRGHRLGRLVKAVNVLRLLDERPDVEAVETWNAASNSHMLAVNVALGFRPREHWDEMEVSVAALTGALA